MSDTTAERLAKYTDRSSDGCWPWRGVIDQYGYGRLTVTVQPRHSRLAIASRLAYEGAFGPIPEGLFVLHHCDNRRCVRPDHLFLGTNADNMADMVAKGRANRPLGVRNAHAKLTDESVRELRRRYALGESQNALAVEFGVSGPTVSTAIRGVLWGHVA